LMIITCHANSEHMINFEESHSEVATAVRANAEEYRLEFHHSLATLDHKPDQAVIAVIGEGMKGRPDVAGKVFGALGRHNINVSAIAQGASERNISCVVDAAQQARALNVIHQGFFETRTPLALVVVGVGNIGGALLRQLYERQPYLLEQGFDAKVIAVANSKRFVVVRDGIDLGRWREALDASTRRMDPRALTQAIAELAIANAALIDCTAESSIVDAYPEFIKANLHIITPNKRANVLPWRRYTALRALFAAHQKHFLYETNARAGLPIISTLRDLIVSGDVITKAEGVFSGTLSYLFNTFDGT